MDHATMLYELQMECRVVCCRSTIDQTWTATHMRQTNNETKQNHQQKIWKMPTTNVFSWFSSLIKYQLSNWARDKGSTNTLTPWHLDTLRVHALPPIKKGRPWHLEWSLNDPHPYWCPCSYPSLLCLPSEKENSSLSDNSKFKQGR
jgi:hypothetical protein